MASCYKDEEYFISSVPTNQHMEAGLAVRGNKGFGAGRLDAAVLDLVGDDNASMQKQKSVYHWDKRSKKYIKLNNGDRVTASGKIKTESGSKVQATKTGIYQRWKKGSHKKVSLRGTDSGNGEDYRGGYSGGSRGDNRNNYKGGKKGSSRIANSHVPSELKNPDQVRKKRQHDANKTSYMKNRISLGRGGDFKGKGSRGDGRKGKNKSGKNGGRKGKSY